MITKKTIKVPIYDYRVIIVVADTLKEVYKIYPDIDYEGKACVAEYTNYSIIAIPPYQPEIIAHECVHLKNCIWKYIGYKPEANNDEVDAYLVGYLFDQVSKVVAKHNLETQC